MVAVREVGLDGQHGPRDNLLNVAPQFLRVVAHLPHLREERRYRPLRPFILLVRVNERIAVLVEGVVGQVHRRLRQVALVRGCVFSGGEPRDALVVKVDSQRVRRGHQGVYPQVKLEPVQQERVVHVPLHDDGAGVVFVDAGLAAREVDAPSHGSRAGLDDVHVVWVGPGVPAEEIELRGVVPCLRREGILARMRGLHSPEVPGERRLAADLQHAGEVVDALERVELGDPPLGHGRVHPAQVPVLLIVANLLEPAFRRHLAQALVLAVLEVDQQPIVVRGVLSCFRHGGRAFPSRLRRRLGPEPVFGDPTRSTWTEHGASRRTGPVR